ncbi:hypothetical protein FHS27_005951 [Rhodopirellula rubra]|uniref:Uncharacterized protein n=1 Tax=Aporhodopirellula rubra TaxID=980271 RepID=A0A7W5E4R1_9BACT|nr:hypothetical protein [Aporhodopirellula rubra]MBB3210105.1 hypothetical protein [Aporhodopirellula rubra]
MGCRIVVPQSGVASGDGIEVRQWGAAMGCRNECGVGRFAGEESRGVIDGDLVDQRPETSWVVGGGVR